MRISTGALLVMAVSIAAGCAEEKKTDLTVTVEKPKSDGSAKDAKSAKAETTARASAETKPAEAPAGDAMPAADLIAKFKADQAAWLDKDVTVDGLYFGSNYAGSGDAKKLNNIQIVASKDDTKTTITCETTDEGPVKGMMQYTAIKVRGKVREMFDKPSLTGCTVVK